MRGLTVISFCYLTTTTEVFAFTAAPRSSPFILQLAAAPQHVPLQKAAIRRPTYLFETSEETSEIVETSPEEEQITLDSIPTDFLPLFDQAAKTAIPKAQDTTKNAHDPFRFEWGSWVDADVLVELMNRVDEVRSAPGAFDILFRPNNADDHGEDGNVGGKKAAMIYKVAGGDKWECLLHVLPTDAQYEGSWPTGSWTVLKALTGVVEVAMLREDRDGGYKKATKKDLRGGSDGTSVVGGGVQLSGEPCIKYVGGPMRSYMGKSGKSLLLEMVVKPKITVDNDEMQIEEIRDIEEILSIVVPDEEDIEATEEEEKEDEEVAISAQEQAQSLGSKLGMNFEQVGGLDSQLDAIVRRVLASRANPEAARRLGISHVRGILLSGPPGCGKTLLARELARLLGAREPQIVNGPEILDKFIGEAEKRVRDLFSPAEREYAQVGDDSALHIIILDEMDAIARKRGSASSDTTGVRDSVVNQLLAKMDGVKQANNVLVVGLTNRPELLDPALLRPGRLEVQLRVELPDLEGRRDILKIHTRQMKEAGGLAQSAIEKLESLDDDGFSARTEHFSGAELAGLVRSAASFALARSVSMLDETDGGIDLDNEGQVVVSDLEQALKEVRPALGKQDEVLQMRYPMGISPCSNSMERIMRDLSRFIAPLTLKAPRLHSMLLVGGGPNGGSGVTALAAWAASQASRNNSADYVRFVTALDLLAGGGGGGTEARASALVEKFSEAREMSNSILVLDDIDQLCAGSGPGGYSSVMISTLRALLRTPPESSSTAKAGGQSITKNDGGKSIHILATTSRSDAACVVLHELFEETIVVPLLSEQKEIEKLISDAGIVTDAKPMAKMMVERLGSVGCKTALRLVERAVSSSDLRKLQVLALQEILDDLAGDEAMASKICRVL